MNITVTLTHKEALFVRAAIALAYAQAKEKAKKEKHDPLLAYEDTEVAQIYKGARKKFDIAVETETKKWIDSLKTGGVQS